MTKNDLIENQDYMSAYTPATPVYEHQEFPKWMHCAETLEAKIVQTTEEAAELIGNWFDFKHEAEAFRAAGGKAEKKIKEVEESVERELEDLLAQAEELGISIDKRWGIKRLREEIGKAAQE